jgi:transcription antitermination factor NusG
MNEHSINIPSKTIQSSDIRCPSEVEALPWFALYVRPRHEKRVSFLLEEKGFKTFLPMYMTRRRWVDRMKTVELPLFPQYVFCRLDTHRRTPIVATPGVLNIVGTGRQPVAVAPSEIESVQRVIDSRLAREPYSFIQAGRRVRIETGSLAGVTGILIEVKRAARLVLSVSLLQRSISVEIDRDSVSPIEDDKLVIAG